MNFTNGNMLNLYEKLLATAHSMPSVKRCHTRLTELTLIIPSYKRPAYLVRNLAWCSQFGAKVIVVDGSEEALPERLQARLAESGLIDYYHSQAALTERIKMASRLVTTKYCMCLADDDFYLSSGLIASIEQLERSPEVSSSMGLARGIDVSLYGVPYLFDYGASLTGYAVDQKVALERVIFGLKNYRSAAFYAVYRTSSFIRIWDGIGRSSCPEQMEYEHAINAYLEGVLVTTCERYWIRSFECESEDSPTDGKRTTEFRSWASSSQFKLEKEQFLVRVSRSLQQYGRIGARESQEVASTLIQMIMSKGHSTLIDRVPLFTRGLLVLRYLASMIPFVRNIFDSLRFSNAGKIIRAKVRYGSRRGRISSDQNLLLCDDRELVDLLAFMQVFKQMHS